MKRTTLFFWCGLLLSLLLLFTLLRKIEFDALAKALSSLNLFYLLAAIILTFCSYWLRALRWRFLLLHERPIPLSSLYPATIIGYMANNIFPARLGELIRAWVLAEKEQLATPAIFASLVIDRLFDGLSVMVMLTFVILLLKLPPGMEQQGTLLKTGGAIALLFYLAVLALLIMLRKNRQRATKILEWLLTPLSKALSGRIINAAGSFVDGVKLSGGVGNLLLILLISTLIWISATLPIQLILLGFGIKLPLVASFFIMVLLVFAVMVPAAPGYIGTYHLACYTGLAAFGLPDTEAVSIALLIHAVGFFPVILAGLYYSWSDRLSFAAIRRDNAGQGIGS